MGTASRLWQCGGSSSDCRGPQKLDTPLRSLLLHSRFKLRKVINLDEAFKLPSLLSLCSRMLRRSSRVLRASLGWAGASAGFAVLLCRACCCVPVCFVGVIKPAVAGLVRGHQHPGQLGRDEFGAVGGGAGGVGGACGLCLPARPARASPRWPPCCHFAAPRPDSSQPAPGGPTTP